MHREINKRPPALGARGLLPETGSQWAVPVILIKDCVFSGFSPLPYPPSIPWTVVSGSFLGSCVFSVHTWDDYVNPMISNAAT